MSLINHSELLIINYLLVPLSLSNSVCIILSWSTLELDRQQHYIFLPPANIVCEGYAGWPRHRENRENREFDSYFFQTGKTQGILL